MSVTLSPGVKSWSGGFYLAQVSGLLRGRVFFPWLFSSYNVQVKDSCLQYQARDPQGQKRKTASSVHQSPHLHLLSIKAHICIPCPSKPTPTSPVHQSPHLHLLSIKTHICISCPCLSKPIPASYSFLPNLMQEPAG